MLSHESHCLHVNHCAGFSFLQQQNISQNACLVQAFSLLMRAQQILIAQLEQGEAGAEAPKEAPADEAAPEINPKQHLFKMFQVPAVHASEHPCHLHLHVAWLYLFPSQRDLTVPFPMNSPSSQHSQNSLSVQVVFAVRPKHGILAKL